ncbi:MAG: phage protein GemA/Gp16 family protein [Thermodesulfobacteriota bacterium]
MLDHKKLAVIHIVKKELGLSDQEYRDALEKITGVRSARELDEPGFRKLMRHFAKSRHYRVNAQGMTFRQQLFIKHLVADLGWEETHFRNFLRKYYKQEDLSALSRREASKVIESLKQILAHRPPPG